MYLQWPDLYVSIPFVSLKVLRFIQVFQRCQQLQTPLTEAKNNKSSLKELQKHSTNKEQIGE